MKHFLNYNGSFLNNSSPLVGADNRGLRYGDGLFETLKVTAGHINFGDRHFERLFNGLRLLEFEFPGYYTAGYLADQVKSLCQKNNHTIARVRINVFRGNGGLYDPENHFPQTIIQSWPLTMPGFAFNENGLVAGIYKAAIKSTDAFSNLKSNNYLPYTMAALHAKKQQWNDALLLNHAGNVCDATIANIFIIKHGIINTPPLADGCVAGIMRQFLLDNLINRGFQLEENCISEADLISADEVFLTNSLKGIRWVKQIGPSTYTSTQTKAIFDKLLKE